MGQFLISPVASISRVVVLMKMYLQDVRKLTSYVIMLQLSSTPPLSLQFRLCLLIFITSKIATPCASIVKMDYPCLVGPRRLWVAIFQTQTFGSSCLSLQSPGSEVLASSLSCFYLYYQILHAT